MDANVALVCVTVIVVAAIIAKCYMEHLSEETARIRANAPKNQRNIDNVPYNMTQIWKKK